MSILNSQIQIKSWQQLSFEEKETMIESIREDVNHRLYSKIHNEIECIIEDNINLKIKDIKEELEKDYGIEAEIFYEFSHRGHGACFEAAEGIDNWKLLSKLNFKNLFNRNDEKFNKVLKDFVDNKLDIYMYRINHHEDNEYSMGFEVKKYFNDIKSELEDIFSDDEIEQNTQEVIEYSKILKEINDAFKVNDLFDFLMKWEKEYCINIKKKLYKNYSLNHAEIFDLISYAIETKQYAFITNENKFIEMIDLTSNTNEV